MPVFLVSINDLFPSIDVPRKRKVKFEEIIQPCVLKEKHQAEDQFIRKIVELEELLNVRHSVFIFGGARSEKTEVWRPLTQTYGAQVKP
jgi:dynein heavy chain